MRRRILATMACGIVLISSTSHAAGISFEQLDWLADGGGYTQQKSDWGKVHVQLAPSDATLLHQQGFAYYAYMNVVTTVPGGATDNWAVQNDPIFFNSLSELTGRGPESLRFDLGTEPGQTRVTDLQYRVTFDAVPLANPPLGSMQQAAVTPVDVLYGGWAAGIAGETYVGNTGLAPPPVAYNYAGALPNPPPGGAVLAGDPDLPILRKGQIKIPDSTLPPMSTLPNHCGPEAAARSLHYLDEMSPFSIPQSPAATAARLADLMDTTLNAGTQENNYLFGKNLFVSEYHLPIMTTVIPGKSIDNSGFRKALDALNAGYDVEAAWSWHPPGTLPGTRVGHVAMVTEIIELAVGGFQVRFINDQNQSDGMAANDIGMHHFNEDGSIPLAPPEEEAKLDAFIIECVPEPTTWSMLLTGLLLMSRKRRAAVS